MNTLFIFGAQYLIAVLLIIAGIYFLQQPWARKKKLCVFGTITFMLIGILGFVANHFYNNPRPFVVGHFAPLIAHDADNGFPSDHVLVAAGIAAIVFVFHRTTGIVLGLIAALIAVSRVYVGVHHAFDVISSFAIAVMSTWVVHLIDKRRTGQ